MTSIPKIACGMHSCCTDEANKSGADESSVSIMSFEILFNGKVYQNRFCCRNHEYGSSIYLKDTKIS